MASVGLVHQTFSVFLATNATYVGAPPDANEAVDVAWRPLEVVVADIRSGTITDGFTLLGATLALAATGHGELFVDRR
jgi:hypothetical protein